MQDKKEKKNRQKYFERRNQWYREEQIRHTALNCNLLVLNTLKRQSVLNKAVDVKYI